MESLSRDKFAQNLSLVVNNANDPSKITFQWIENFFSQMEKRYPFVWRESIKITNCSSEEIKQFWFDDLNKTSTKKFLAAAEYAFTSNDFEKYPPTLARMGSLCRETPEDYGCLGEDKAYQMYLRREHKESAPLRHANKKINHYDVVRMPAEKTKAYFLEAYRSVISKIMAGDLSYLVFVEEPKQKLLPSKADMIGIEHREKSTSTLRAEMRASLGLKKL